MVAGVGGGRRQNQSGDPCFVPAVPGRGQARRTLTVVAVQ